MVLNFSFNSLKYLTVKLFTNYTNKTTHQKKNKKKTTPSVFLSSFPLIYLSIFLYHHMSHHSYLKFKINHNYSTITSTNWKLITYTIKKSLATRIHLFLFFFIFLVYLFIYFYGHLFLFMDTYFSLSLEGTAYIETFGAYISNLGW